MVAPAPVGLDLDRPRSVGVAHASLRPMGIFGRRVVLDPRTSLGTILGLVGLRTWIRELVSAGMEQPARVRLRERQRLRRTAIYPLARVDGRAAPAIRVRVRQHQCGQCEPHQRADAGCVRGSDVRAAVHRTGGGTSRASANYDRRLAIGRRAPTRGLGRPRSERRRRAAERLRVPCSGACAAFLGSATQWQPARADWSSAGARREGSWGGCATRGAPLRHAWGHTRSGTRDTIAPNGSRRRTGTLGARAWVGVDAVSGARFRSFARRTSHDSALGNACPRARSTFPRHAPGRWFDDRACVWRRLGPTLDVEPGAFSCGPAAEWGRGSTDAGGAVVSKRTVAGSFIPELRAVRSRRTSRQEPGRGSRLQGPRSNLQACT